MNIFDFKNKYLIFKNANLKYLKDTIKISIYKNIKIFIFYVRILNELMLLDFYCRLRENYVQGWKFSE